MSALRYIPRCSRCARQPTPRTRAPGSRNPAPPTPSTNSFTFATTPDAPEKKTAGITRAPNQPVARRCSAPAHRHVVPAGQCRQAPCCPPTPPSAPPSLPRLRTLTFPVVAAHAAGDDSASHASSSASNSSPSPSHNKRNSLASVGASARLPSSAGGLGLGHVRWLAFRA